VGEGHAELSEVLVTGGVGAETAVAIVEDLGVSSARLGVAREPRDALLTGGRDDRLELGLLAPETEPAESVGDESFDCEREARGRAERGRGGRGERGVVKGRPVSSGERDEERRKKTH
jgi:hypothetical protein